MGEMCCRKNHVLVLEAIPDMLSLHGPHHDVSDCRVSLRPSAAEKVFPVPRWTLGYRVALLRSQQASLDILHAGHDNTPAKVVLLLYDVGPISHVRQIHPRENLRQNGCQKRAKGYVHQSYDVRLPPEKKKSLNGCRVWKE